MTNSNILLNKAIESIGGKEEFRRKSQQYRNSMDFVEGNRAELLKRYDENWIAVYNSQLVAHGEKFGDVMKNIQKARLPVEEVLVEFISSRKIITLFYK